jgi:hypothetical protein
MDMWNAQPYILLGLSKLYNVPLPCLNDYVENRDDRIKTIMETFSCSRKIAKHLVLIILFGGSFKTWAEDNHMHIDGSARAPDFIHSMLIEYTDWQNLVFQRSKELSLPDLKIEEMTDKEKRSSFALILQTLERRCVCHAIEFVKSKGYVTGSIIHDGFLIEKKGSKPILAEVNKYVSEKMSFDVIFAWEEF